MLLDIFMIHKFASNYCSANVSPNFDIFMKKMFYHKIHTFSSIKISLIYTYFWKNIHKALIFYYLGNQWNILSLVYQKEAH